MAGLLLKTWLAWRQIRHVAAHRSRVPPSFEGSIDLPAHQRAADYTVARTRLSWIESGIAALVLTLLLLLGGLQWIHDHVLAMTGNGWIGAITFVIAVAVVDSAADLPISYYRQFVLERRFGFNRMTPWLFAADTLKETLVAILLGVPLIALVLWLMRSTGTWWWLYAWVAWTGFNLLVLLLYPTVIAPLFNRFEPLDDTPVRKRVEALLGRCGFRSNGLFVMDASRRSSHGNAFFTGLGRAKRIVFFDTLLSRLDPEEIEAVLAHELGHFHHRHVLKRLAAGLFTSLAALALLGFLARQPWFYQGLGLTPAPEMLEAGALVLFFLVVPVFSFPLRPVIGWVSRRDEFEADAYAACHARAESLVSALTKLYESNASTLTPDPIHSAFYDSHPPAALRIGRLLGQAS
ncbi:MAG: M48 family metallopeptidase [Burkholderiaceae bacterium]